MFEEERKGEMLIENIVFIVLNIVFFLILIVFLSGSSLSSENTAKQLALVIDSSEPGDMISIDFERIVNEAEKNGVDKDEIVRIVGNKIIVSLEKGKQSEYSFFNDVKIESPYPLIDKNKLVMVVK